MNEVFKIASFSELGVLTLLKEEFPTYVEAVNALESLPEGTYQIQKVFVKYKRIS